MKNREKILQSRWKKGRNKIIVVIREKEAREKGWKKKELNKGKN